MRHANTNWNLPSGDSDGRHSWESIQTAVLMDLRDELREITHRLHPLTCRNFIDIPTRLNRIARNTAPPKPKRRRHKQTRGL
jgi:hypothetical protein